MMTQSNDTILYLCRREVEELCKDIDSVAVMREVFRLHASGSTVLPDEAYLEWTNEQGERVRSLNMPGYIGGSSNIAGTKIINGNIHNPARGLPRASGLTLLYDRTSGRIVCIMEGAYLSSLRTASVTALMVDLLKGREIECIAMIGAGVLARIHIDLLVRRLPGLRSIQLFDIDKQRVAALQEEVSPLLQAHDVTLHVSASPEEAIKPAQLIVPVTTTASGYIRFGWLQRGSILVNISLDDPLPEVVFKADKVIVDDWNLVSNDSRRLIGRMYRQGQVVGPDEEPPAKTPNHPYRRIDTQIGEIVAGTKEGRRSVDDIIMVNPFGLAIEDVSLAAYVYLAALERKFPIHLEY